MMHRHRIHDTWDILLFKSFIYFWIAPRSLPSLTAVCAEEPAVNWRSRSYLRLRSSAIYFSNINALPAKFLLTNYCCFKASCATLS